MIPLVDERYRDVRAGQGACARQAAKPSTYNDHSSTLHLNPVACPAAEIERTLPLGIMHFMGSHQLDVGMVATGLMIAIAPIILLYACFSETMIKGMTAGAVR